MDINPKDRGSYKQQLVLLFICPLLGLFSALGKIKNKDSKKILLFFAAIYGFTVYVPSAKEYIDLSVDSTYYRMHFETISVKEDFDEFCYRFVRYLTFDIDEVGDIIKDYYLETISYLASFGGHNYHFLFMLAAIISAYYCIKCLSFFVDNNDYQYSWYCLFLLLVFLYNQPVQIHWLRFPTAAWIAVYSIFKIFINNDKRYWLLAISTIIIHGSFIAFIVLLAIASYTQKYVKLWIFLFFVSLFISSVPSGILDSLVSVLPPRIGMYLQYASEETLNENVDLINTRRTGALINLFSTTQSVFMNVLMILIIKEYKKRQIVSRKIVLATIILFTIVNLFAFVYEFSMRYRLITYPLVMYVWLQFFGSDRRYKKVIYLIPIVFSYQMAYYAYLYYKTSGIDLVLSPFITITRNLFIVK